MRLLVDDAGTHRAAALEQVQVSVQQVDDLQTAASQVRRHTQDGPVVVVVTGRPTVDPAALAPLASSAYVLWWEPDDGGSAERTEQAIRAGVHQIIPAGPDSPRLIRAWIERHGDADARNLRLQALGQAAAGVAHDVNNVLCTVAGRAQMIRAALTDRPEVVRSLEILERTTAEGVHILERIQRFLQPVCTEPAGLVEPSSLLQEAAEACSWHAAQTGVGLRIEARDAEPLHGDVHSLREALVNLVRNGLDASGPGGTLSLRCGRPPEPGWVEFQVEDDGPGMDPEVRDRAFEPFFTTKGRQGTGLGLPLVADIVARHGGVIRLDSEPGQGTRFTLRFPAAAAKLRGAEPDTDWERTDTLDVSKEKTPASSAEPPKSVLVVEDDDGIRKVLEELLSGEGFRVRVAATGRQAQEALAEETFDLILTDLEMPDMDGWSLVQEARRNPNHGRLFVMTGRGPHQDPPNAPPADGIFRKPFRFRELLRALRPTRVSGHPNPRVKP